MKFKMKNKVHPGVAAILLLAVIILVQWVWWRGLVYRPPLPAAGGRGAGPGGGANQLLLVGRTDVHVDTYAGDLEPGDSDGPGHSARFDRPTGMALDAQGNLYVADTGNHRIRKVSLDGQVLTVAGGEAGYKDGPATDAQFNSPCGVSVAPDGDVYVSDTGNSCIRLIKNGQVTTISGSPSDSIQTSGSHAIRYSLPSGINYVDGSPNPAASYLLVADTGNKKVRKLNLDGSPVSEQTVAGPPTSVYGLSAVAIPQAGTIMLGSTQIINVPIGGSEGASPEFMRALSLRHPVGLWPVGNDWLVLDDEFGAIFLYRNGKAEIVAGHCSSAGPLHGSNDGDGAHSTFSNLSGVITDGKKYAYVSDTTNNIIRRLDISSIIGQ